MTSTSTLRDATKPFEYYEQYIADRKTSSETLLKQVHRAPNLLNGVAKSCFQIGLASYSAGFAAQDCLERFREAVTYAMRVFSEALKYQFTGSVSIFDYMDMLAAARLTGQVKEFVNELGRCKYKDTDPRQIALIEQLCSVLSGKPAFQRFDTQAKLDKDWALLIPLFQSVHDGKQDTFARALEDYLVKDWGKSAEKLAKIDLKSPFTLYSGKWCLLAAALCAQMGGIPALSQKALVYVPVDLLSARS